MVTLSQRRRFTDAAMLPAFFAGLFVTMLASAHEHPAYWHEDVDSWIEFGTSDWMGTLDGNLRISDLSIPGTHDTMSHYGGDIAKTQTLRLQPQLALGIRALDIRCRHIEDVFAIHHSQVFQNAFFGDVLEECIGFLDRHPSETILMRVQEEYNPENNTRSFAETFQWYVDIYGASNFWTPPLDSNNNPNGANQNPTLDEIRGKIVILQAFPSTPSNLYGLRYQQFNIQDEFELADITKLYDKWLAVKSQLHDAYYGDPDKIYVNFLSGSAKNAAVIVLPYFVASGHSNPSTGAPRLATGLTTPGWNGSYPDFPRVNCFLGICTIAYEGTNILSFYTIELRNNFNEVGAGLPCRAGILYMDFPGIGMINEIIRANDFAIPVGPAPNGAPTARTDGPYTVDEGSPLLLDASTSTDPEDEPITFHWDFDLDGTYDTDWSSDPTVSNLWADDFTGDVGLEVRDIWDATGMALVEVRVRNVRPTPTITALGRGVNYGVVGEPSEVLFDIEDPGDDTHTYIVEWGDGTIDDPLPADGLSGLAASHTYTETGVYEVKVEVEDDDGGLDKVYGEIEIGLPSDSDEDGLDDEFEIRLYNTKPDDPDSDNDSFGDGEEIDAGTDPLDPLDPGREEDIDNDGNVNSVDVQFVINIVLGLDMTGAMVDLNGDGRTGAVEVQTIINYVLGI